MGEPSADIPDVDHSEALRAQILHAANGGHALRIRGGGTKDWYGRTLCGEVLSTRQHRGIVSYDPSELVLTVRCGSPLAEVERILQSHGQQLPFEPPHFGPDATAGGCIAAGLAGPARMSSGSVRDSVLGASLIDGRGQMLRFGGQVMKNVAGFDVARLLAGSLGVLGLILDVSLKLAPRPARETTLRFELDQARALEQFNRWAGQSLPISATVWHAHDGKGECLLRLSGSQEGVEAARRRLGGEEISAATADALWWSLREQTHRFFRRTDPQQKLWRLAVPASTPPCALSPSPLIEWSGCQRWYWSDADMMTMRQIARSAAGHAVLFRRDAECADVFDTLPESLLAIHRRLKHAFDPGGVFGRARLIEGI